MASNYQLLPCCAAVGQRQRANHQKGKNCLGHSDVKVKLRVVESVDGGTKVVCIECEDEFLWANNHTSNYKDHYEPRTKKGLSVHQKRLNERAQGFRLMRPFSSLTASPNIDKRYASAATRQSLNYAPKPPVVQSSCVEPPNFRSAPGIPSGSMNMYSEQANFVMGPPRSQSNLHAPLGIVAPRRSSGRPMSIQALID